MRYRELTASGDYKFGHANQFLINSPEAVAQAIKTRLLLITGEWFLDLTEGTDYFGSILGNNTQGVRDIVLQDRILSTPGVESIISYQSVFDPRERSFTVVGQVDTQFGVADFNVTG